MENIYASTMENIYASTMENINASTMKTCMQVRWKTLMQVWWKTFKQVRWKTFMQVRKHFPFLPFSFHAFSLPFSFSTFLFLIPLSYSSSILFPFITSIPEFLPRPILHFRRPSLTFFFSLFLSSFNTFFLLHWSYPCSLSSSLLLLLFPSPLPLSIPFVFHALLPRLLYRPSFAHLSLIQLYFSFLPFFAFSFFPSLFLPSLHSSPPTYLLSILYLFLSLFPLSSFFFILFLPLSFPSFIQYNFPSLLYYFLSSPLLSAFFLHLSLHFCFASDGTDNNVRMVT